MLLANVLHCIFFFTSTDSVHLKMAKNIVWCAMVLTGATIVV